MQHCPFHGIYHGFICPDCNALGQEQRRQQEALAGIQQQRLGYLKYTQTPDYDKLIKDLETKFIESQKLLVDEIEKLNERIIFLEDTLSGVSSLKRG